MRIFLLIDMCLSGSTLLVFEVWLEIKGHPQKRKWAINNTEAYLEEIGSSSSKGITNHGSIIIGQMIIANC